MEKNMKSGGAKKNGGERPAEEEVIVVRESFEEGGLPAGKVDRFLPISILVSAVLIGGALVFSTLYRGTGGAGIFGGPTDNQGAPQGGAAGNADAMKLGPRDAILGNANAPVTVIEYGDYQCPFCTRFFTQTQSQIVSNYVNSGKVKMVFRNFAFLGPESAAAAAAAECANDQKKLWPYHDALYQTKADDEAKGGGENDGSLNRALFIKLAQNLNMDVTAFTSCIDSNKYASLVAEEKAAAGAFGVNSTPFFFINGKQILGAEPYASFAQAIDAALKR